MNNNINNIENDIENNIDNNIENDNILLALKYAKKVLKNLDRPNIKKHLKKSLQLLKKFDKTEEINDLISQTESQYKKVKNTNLFKLISKNEIKKIDKIKKYDFREFNQYGNTILHHCIKVGDSEILKILLKKGGNINEINGNGHTLLEYACLCKDPNIINILLLLGADMKKHLFFRKGNNKFFLYKNDIDLAILLKILVFKSFNYTDYKNFEFLLKYFNINEFIGLEKFTIKNILCGLNNLFENKNSYITYKNIVEEELEFYLKNTQIDNCYKCPLDIILINLVPFINYPFNITSDFIIRKELEYCIKKILNENKKNYKNLLLNYIFSKYIETKLFKEDYIGIIVYRIIKDLKI